MNAENYPKVCRSAFPDRLKNARKKNNLSQEGLAEKTRELEAKSDILYKSVSSTAIERYENGVMYPDNERIMVTLAKALGVTSDSLTAPLTINIDYNGFEFRKKSKLGKKAQDAIKSKVVEIADCYFEIEKIMDENIPFNVDLSYIMVDSPEKAREAAKQLRQQWNIGMTPIPNPIPLLEMKGVKVIEVEEDPTLFDGTCNMVDGCPIVVLNINDTPAENSRFKNCQERRNLTAFHEIGHKVMHFAEGLKEKEVEGLCNVFASEMLIPSEVFTSIVGTSRSNLTFSELKELQKQYGISIRALLKKAQQLGVISDSRYKRVNIMLNTPQYEKIREYIDKTELCLFRATRMFMLMTRALSSDLISQAKADNYSYIINRKINRDYDINSMPQ